MVGKGKVLRAIMRAGALLDRAGILRKVTLGAHVFVRRGECPAPPAPLLHCGSTRRCTRAGPRTSGRHFPVATPQTLLKDSEEFPGGEGES